VPEHLLGGANVAALEVAPGLFVGGLVNCAMPDSQWTRGAECNHWTAIVHACKFPCHAELLGYAGKGKVDSSSPEYLMAKRGRHLVLNMIDAEERFFRPEFFREALDHIEAGMWAKPARVLVHCNQGVSRSPSIALLYIAKRTTLLDPLDRATFDAARKAFEHLYPAYVPGKGIAAFLDRWWEHLA